MRSQALPLLLLLVSIPFAACDSDSTGDSEPPVPAETTAAVNSSVQLALSEAANSFEFLNDSELADDLFDLLPGGDSGCASSPAVPDGVAIPDEGSGEPMDESAEEPAEEPVDPPMDQPMDDDCGEQVAEFDVDFQDAAKEASQWVANEVLTEANVEEVAGNSVIYLLPTSLICDGLDGGDDETESEAPPAGAPMTNEEFCAAACPGSECSPDRDEEECANQQEMSTLCMDSCMQDMDGDSGPMDPRPEEPMVQEDGMSCAELFDQVPLRLRVTASGGGHTIDLLVGAKKSNPVSAFVAPDELSLELDIEGSMESLETLAEAAGEDAPELPQTLEGRVKLGLKKNAEDSYTVALSVLKAIHVVLGIDGDDLAFQLGTSTPTIALTADGNAKALSLDVDVAAIDVALPGSIFAGETCTWDEITGEEFCETDDSLNGDIALHVGGASVSMALTSGSDEDAITVTNAGLGDSTTTVAYDGQQIIGLDLNADHGRRLDISITSLEDVLQLAVDPALVVQAALDLAKAPDLAEDAPQFLLDEDMTVSLTGATPTVSVGDHGLRVESGTLLLSSTSTTDVVVEAGMCVDMGGDEDLEADHRDEGSEEGFDPSEEEESGGDEHPFSEMKATSCD